MRLTCPGSGADRGGRRRGITGRSTSIRDIFGKTFAQQFIETCRPEIRRRPVYRDRLF
jgi:hypothetical protein